MYSAAPDIEKLVAPEVLAQLADDGPGAAATAEEVIAEAIEQADREIDAYIGAVAPTPMDPPHPLIANLSPKIALYNLFRRRPHLEAGEWGEEYKRCVRLLEMIAAGKINLGAADAEGNPAEPLDPGRTVVVTGPLQFPDEDLERY